MFRFSFRMTFLGYIQAIVLFIGVVSPRGLWADFTIKIDYSLDTNNFFNTQARKDALQAVTNRFQRVLAPSSLAAVSASGTGSGTPAGWRVGLSHPGTGASYQISTAASSATDTLVAAGAANQYGFSGLAINEWTLYAGGRVLGGPAGVGGTATGSNFTSTFDDLNGPLHRGLIANTPSNTVNDLPVWGGAISFDTTTNWHFGVATAASGTSIDFFTIALHEVGHALGLATSWNQIGKDISGIAYSGSNTLAAFNADNGTGLISIDLVSAADHHFKDATYQSLIFAGGAPELAGTVGLATRQDLLMEPIANFSSSVRRFELTNTDVAQLRDIGWSTITAVPEPSFCFLLIAVAGCGWCGHRLRFTRRQ